MREETREGISKEREGEHGANKVASLFEVSSRGLALERLLAFGAFLVNPDANK